MAALADAAAKNTCWALHQGGKAAATSSAPARTCSDNAAMTAQLAISSAAAFSHAGHRVLRMIFPGSIPEEYRDEADRG
jgi:tRNA A37 threonylcarbamoyltransferase TsaD